jgi:DNA anti-recombination protein RmuC
LLAGLAARAAHQVGDAMKKDFVLRMTLRHGLTCALMLLALQGFAVMAQVLEPSQTPDASIPGSQRQRESDNPWSQQQKRDMLKKQNEQRQQEIKKDTDQLLELATELKQYVDKTNENIISLDVIKKAEQIEKLAKNVKDKMKGP